MRLSALVADVPHRRAGAPGDPEIAAVTHDSRRAGPGALFAAFPGARNDGRSFVPDAVARGAAAAMGLTPAPAALAVPYIEVANPRRAAGLAAAVLAGLPAQRLVMVGVTGTSGKTTTACLVDHLLGRRHPKRGLFGTLVYRGAGGEGAAVPAAHTTPEATDLQPMLAALAKDGGTAATMECSSHALVLDRLAGCSFDTAVFLNLSREHLDFHRDLDDYFEAKARLFGMLKPGGRAVVNLGDAYGRRLAEKLGSKSTTGFFLEGEEGTWQAGAPALVSEAAAAASHGDLSARAFPVLVVGRAVLSTTGTRLEVAAPREFTFEENPRSPGRSPSPGGSQQKVFVVHSPLLGRPNAENLLAAAATGIALGLSPDEISSALSEVDRIPGRLEPVPNALGLTVLVDYAHKPGALRGVLGTARSLASSSGGRVVVLFGCGGDRDRGKRPEMGRIAVEMAEEVVVTSDNPRSEDPDAILQEIAAGITPTGHRATYLVDRREAIGEALRRARRGDVVLLAGKGHETYQLVEGREEPFDDRIVAKDLLDAMERRAPS